VLRKTPVALVLVAAWGLALVLAAAQTSPASPLVALAALPASAASTAPASATGGTADQNAPLPAITSTATRTNRRVDDVPATVTVAPATDIKAAGAGKCTLLRLTAGERVAHGGQALLDGRPRVAWPVRDLAQRRAVLPDSHAVAFALTG
jgi:outer membrane receptor protein involved in Fe transport